MAFISAARLSLALAADSTAVSWSRLRLAQQGRADDHDQQGGHDQPEPHRKPGTDAHVAKDHGCISEEEIPSGGMPMQAIVN
ncbi:MAG: hypothetical protein MZW92_14095 [Comamonadaceae bacterium]|nr:hypothetical protein [Comamonadaceae bacterium]